MKRYICEHFDLLFFLIFIPSLLLGNIMKQDRELLLTKSAPSGIYNLQVSHDFNLDTLIRREWFSKSITRLNFYRDSTKTEITNGLQTAQEQIRVDYYFVPLYVLLLCLCLVKANVKPGADVPEGFSLLSYILFGLALIAGMMNIIADYQLAKFFERKPFNLNLIYFPSLIKWWTLRFLVTLLLLRVIFKGWLVYLLKQATDYLIFIKVNFLRFRIVVIGLLVIFILLWGVDQIQDLLLGINTSRGGPVLFLSAVSVLALLNWYLPKLYDHAGAEIKTLVNTRVSFEDEGREDKSDLARMLGAATFLIPAVSILHAMKTFHMQYFLDQISPLALLVGSLIFYYLIVKKKLVTRYYMRDKDNINWARFNTTLMIIGALVIGFGVMPNATEPYFLAYLSLDFFLLSLAFFLITSLREQIVASNQFFGKWGVQPFVMVPGIIFFLGFLYSNFFPLQAAFSAGLRYFTLPLVFSAIIFYTLVFSFLLLWGRRIKIHLITILYGAGLLVAIVAETSFHQVRFIHRAGTVRKYESLNAYAQGWLQHRKIEIDSFHKNFPKDTFPVIIVNTYGGGIRASAWTAFVIGELDSKLKNNRPLPGLSNDIQHYIFAYSGASGGTIGASALCAARYSDLASGHPDTTMERHAIDFFNNDFLSPVMVCLLGRDVWGAFSASSFYPDRGSVQERNWEKHSASTGFSYASGLGSYWNNRTYEVPMLFSNTFDVDSGKKAIAVPLSLSRYDFPGTIFIDSLMTDKADEMRMSSAAFLSARFPFISPTGKINGQHFADGGNIENSGAETALEVQKVFRRILDELQKTKDSAEYKLIKLHIISLPNSLKGAQSVEKPKNLFELTAPLLGILNTINGNASKADLTNQLFSNTGHFGYHRIAPTLPASAIKGAWPVYPLGWQISDAALKQMKRSLDSNPGIAEIIQLVRPIHQ
jgi:hypothetical protein